MTIVCFDGLLSIDGTPVHAGVRYIVSEDIAQTMITEGAKAGIKLIHHSGYNSYERRLRPEAIKAGDVICLWRHNAFGDNLMVTGLAAYLKLRFNAKVHIICAPQVIPIWMAMDESIKPESVGTTPIHFDAVLHLYDWTVFWQAMLEENRELDQGCGLDDLWRYAGFDEGIGEEYRRPVLRQFSRPKGDAIGYALHSGNSTRTMPLEWSRDLIIALHDKYPDREIFIYGTNKAMSAQFDEYKLPVTNLIGRLSFEQVIQTVESKVGVMVGPDSALMHLAEGLNIPNVGLWGLFHPNDRVKHYRFHTAIDNFDSCKYAPCRWHGMNKLPLDKCGPLHAVGHCNALSTIPIERVVDAV